MLYTKNVSNRNRMKKEESITIREAVAADYERILELFNEFSAFENHAGEVTNNVELMKSEADYFNALVAVNNAGIIVGYTIWFYSYPTWIGKSLYMEDLYVQPEYRGEGLGSMLIKALIKHAKSKGCKKMHWQVSDWNNTAIDFYESLGAKIDRNKYNCDLKL